MSKCIDCRKNEALDTRWERIRHWFFFKMFPRDIISFSQEKFTQGFADGYKTGFEHAQPTIKKITAEDIVDLYEQTEPKD
jgi:hypothetical protein